MDFTMALYMFWIVIVNCYLAAVLIGRLVPITMKVPCDITSADLSRLRSEIAASMEHMDKVVEERVEKRLSTERHLTNAALQQLKNEHGELIARLLSDVEALKARLTEIKKSEAVLLQLLHIQQYLNSAKEWLKLVPQEVYSVTATVDKLRDDLPAKEEYLSEKLLALEKTVDNKIRVSLFQLVLELQTASASIEGLTRGADSQLASLEEEVSQLRSVGEEEKREVVERLDVLEGAGLDREEVAKVFQEEMEKSVGSNSSVLWMWLSQELTRAEGEREVSVSGLTRKEVDQLIKAALARHSADQFAKFDFALENTGGMVVASSETYPRKIHRIMGVTIWTVPGSPKPIIQPSVDPGDCWGMNGSKGYALIKLKEPVVVSGVTLEHIPKELSPSGSLSSAPRDFRVLGKNGTEPVTEGDVLGQFSYTTEGTPIQEFTVKNGKAYTHILFDILSNHGNPHYTCVYRVRVHGRPATTQLN